MSHRAAVAEAFPEHVARLRAALASTAMPAALRPALDSLDWATPLPNGAAPGFVYLAGARRGVPVGGGGRDLAEAAGRLAGEASEALAQETAPAPADLSAEPALAAIWGEGPCLAAVDLASGRVVGAPLASVFSAFPAAEEAPPRSLGLAAGPDASTARLAGLLELIERDAAAVWWSGAARPRVVSATDLAAAAAELRDMRAGAGPGRPTTFLALPSVAGLPVVCAFSRDASGGMAFGLKAALDAGAAAAGAARELLQMEIALEVARLRARQGRGTAADSAVLRRAALDPDGYPAFAPLPPCPADEAPPAGLDALVVRLARLGIVVFAADLAAVPGGLAVAKIFAPRLQPLPGRGPAPALGAPGARAALM